MLENLLQLDTKLFYAINGTHNQFFDAVFWTLSQHWFIAVVLVAVFLLVTLRKEKRTWWLILLCVGLSFLFADRISVLCFKDAFCRLRPCHVLENVRLFDGHCGGKYGFVSSHAANAFALATFFSFVYKKIKYFPWLIFAWAILVGYSRPYLGVHYPGDVICGAVLGTGLGSIVYLIYIKIYNRVFLRKADTSSKRE